MLPTTPKRLKHRKGVVREKPIITKGPVAVRRWARKEVIGKRGDVTGSGRVPSMFARRFALKRLAEKRTRAPRGIRLQLTSPCSGTVAHDVELGPDQCFRDFCPVCRRPVVARLVDSGRQQEKEEQVVAAQEDRLWVDPSAVGRFAYVAVLWGSSPSYVLGAMVLAKSLRMAQTRHDLVLLHANVAGSAVDLLRRSGWIPREVKPVYGVSALYNHGEPRFEGVFTKLQALALCEYEKVLLLDIDTLAYLNMDAVFELPAPAAMARGPFHAYQHGMRIDGSCFFYGADTSGYGWGWGQRGGINAGVMLMQPNRAEHKQMMSEVLDEHHPEHIKGNGPEQDYLSRYWASRWTHIGVEYNFQLHQMYFMLNPRNMERHGERARFLQDPAGADIRLVHYSGALKPWARVLDLEYASDPSRACDERFLDDVLRSFNAYWFWVLRDRETFEQAGVKEGMGLDAEGNIRYIDWTRYTSPKPWWAVGESRAADPEADRDVEEENGPTKGILTGSSLNGQREELPLGEVAKVSDAAVQAAESIVRASLARWMETFAALEQELGLGDLAVVTRRACGLTDLATSQGPVDVASEVAAVPAETKAGSPGLAPPGAEPGPYGWKTHGGWWVDRPVRARAAALAGCTPEPFVQLSVRCQPVVDVRGPAASGFHLAAVVDGGHGAADRILRRQANHDLTAWCNDVPSGAILLLACVDADPAVWTSELATLRSCGFEGAPKSFPPTDCGAVVMVGTKGGREAYQTMAAADFALASLEMTQRIKQAAE